MKRNIFANIIGMFLVCGGMSMGFCSCDDETVSPALDEKVLISEINVGVTPNLPLLINTDSLMTWEVLPEEATNKNVIWTSANPEIASVSEDGRISAHALGTAVVTVSPEWGYATAASVTVEVIDHIVFIDDIVLTNPEDELSVYATASLQLTWETVPEEPTYPGLKWESLTPEVATVSESGLVRGVAAGTAQIRATATDSRHFSKVFEIAVMPVIPIESLEIDESQSELAIGEVSKLKVKVTPENATVSTLVWESSNPSVVSFDEDGVMTVHDYGSVTITASAEYGGSSVSAALDAQVVEGKVNDTFDYTAPWAIFNNVGMVVGIEDSELVLTPGDDKNYKAVRIARTGGVNFHAGNYPILAVKVWMPGDVVAESDKMEYYLDIWTKGQTPAGKYGENTDKGKNQMEVKDCGDYKVYVADFTRKGLGASNEFLPSSAINMENVEFQWWKLWYDAGVPLDGTIKIDWVKTFRSEEELDALIASESGIR